MAAKDIGVLTFLCIAIAVASATTPGTTTLGPICPHGCNCTDDYLNVDCSRRGLLAPPALSGLVTRLDLSGNLLGPMVNVSFEHLRNLRELDLSGNQLSRMLLCTFAALLHLRRVDLHGNRLASLPSGLFADSVELEELDLSHNELEELPDLVLSGLRNLKVLNVSHNRVTHLYLGLRFQTLTQLRVLDLSHNPFRNISENAFEMASQWDHSVRRSLDLAHCQLENMSAVAFLKIPGLGDLSLAGNGRIQFSQVVDVLKQMESSGIEVLNLSDMNISTPDLFSNVTLMALKELDMSGNGLAAIPAGTFGNIRSLQQLDLSQNHLTRLHEGFQDLVNLQKLNISHCRLESFKGTAVGHMQHLTILDLSHNQLQNAAEVDLSPLHALQMLDLSHNKLQSPVLPGTTRHLISVNFAFNALASLSSMSDMHSLRYFDAHNNNIQTLGDYLFTEGRGILIANFSHNNITDLSLRIFLPSSPQVIDLSHNFLKETSFYSWTSTREVYLNNNSINHVEQNTFFGMDNLEVLDLSHNNISTVYDESFKSLGNLTSLYLSHNILNMCNFFLLFRPLESLHILDMGYNHLSTINSSSLQKLVNLRSLSLAKNKMNVISVELFHHLEKLEEVDISGNPFHCGCELLPLQDWLSKTNVRIQQHYDWNVTNMCHSPPKHAGKMVTIYTVEQFECNTTLLYMIIFGSIGGLGIIIGVIASLVCHYYRKWHKTYRGNKDKKEKLVDVWQGKPLKQVDLVRVSKKAYQANKHGKQDIINGWVVSKQVSPPKLKAIPRAHIAELQQRQGPQRPPMPVKVRKHSQSEEKWRERAEPYFAHLENAEYQSRSAPKMYMMMPPRESHRPYEKEKSRPTMPVWQKRYCSDNPIQTPQHSQDRWDHAYTYQTWGQPAGMYAAPARDPARYYTLQQPATWRQPPYGPNYPYRIWYDETDYQRPYSSRTLPQPPREQELKRREVYAHNDVPPRSDARDYQQDYYSRDGGFMRDVREQAYLRDCEEKSTAKQDYRDTDRREVNRHTQPEERDQPRNNCMDGNQTDYQRDPQGGVLNPDVQNPESSNQGDNSKNENTIAKSSTLKRRTSETQTASSKRDSDYRNAMENPIGPDVSKAPAESKSSEWL